MATYKKQLRDKDNNVIYPAQGLGTITSDNIDWSSFASSASGNAGYIQIGNLLVQWGRSSAYVGSGAPAESSSFTVSFDKAFASNPFATIQMEDIPGVCGEYSVVFGTSTTNFTGVIGHTTAADAGTRYFRWLAVGKAA